MGEGSLTPFGNTKSKKKGRQRGTGWKNKRGFGQWGGNCKKWKKKRVLVEPSK